MTSLVPARYRHLPPGRHRLIYLGNLILKPNQGWKLAAYLLNEQAELSPHYFRVEALADLRIGQWLQDRIPEPMPADKTFWVTLPGKSDWKVETAANAIPASLWPLYSQPELCQQQVYVFRQGNRNYVLPVIELARALLIRNKPIARQLFMSAGLNQLALVNQHRPFQGQAEIKFREETPLYLIDNPQVLYHLIWLLLHPEPSRLFSSVYRHMVEQQGSRASQTYRRFTFTMDIPDLPGMKMEYAGPIRGNTVFVREVLGFSRLPGHGYKPLFSHPARKQPVKNGGVQASASPVLLDTAETLEIDEQEDDAGTGRHTRFAEIRPVTFEYAVEPDVELVYEGQQQTNHGQQRDIRPTEEAGTETGSLGDPAKDSSSKPVDYGEIICSKQDKTGGLRLFKEVCEQLAISRSWSVRLEYYELPSVSRTSFRLLKDRPRQAGLATFYLPDGTTRHLLEVQISDGRYLSTLYLYSPDHVHQGFVRGRVKALLWALVKGGGHWKQTLLKKISLRPLRVKKIRHPNGLADMKGSEAIPVWLEKFRTVLNS